MDKENTRSQRRKRRKKRSKRQNSLMQSQVPNQTTEAENLKSLNQEIADAEQRMIDYMNNNPSITDKEEKDNIINNDIINNDIIKARERSIVYVNKCSAKCQQICQKKSGTPFVDIKSGQFFSRKKSKKNIKRFKKSKKYKTV